MVSWRLVLTVFVITNLAVRTTKAACADVPTTLSDQITKAAFIYDATTVNDVATSVADLAPTAASEVDATKTVSRDEAATAADVATTLSAVASIFANMADVTTTVADLATTAVVQTTKTVFRDGAATVVYVAKNTTSSPLANKTITADLKFRYVKQSTFIPITVFLFAIILLSIMGFAYLYYKQANSYSFSYA
jgi:hypothetical protein